MSSVAAVAPSSEASLIIALTPLSHITICLWKNGWNAFIISFRTTSSPISLIALLPAFSIFTVTMLSNIGSLSPLPRAFTTLVNSVMFGSFSVRIYSCTALSPPIHPSVIFIAPAALPMASIANLGNASAAESAVCAAALPFFP